MELPKKLLPVLAEISKNGELGKEGWYEVVYHNGERWQHFAGSDTFDDGEKVLQWRYTDKCLPKIGGQVQPPVKPACGNCEYYKPDYELSGLGNCKNTEVMGSRIILKYCEEFYLAEDFGCTRFESKSV